MNIQASQAKNFFVKDAGLGQAEKKRTELERYFPGLYTTQNRGGVPRPSASGQNVAIDKTKQVSNFSAQLNDAITREKIKQEVGGDPERKKLYNAALEFQSLFIDKMLGAMRKNLNPKNDLLYGGFRQKIFEDMLYEEYSRKLSRTNSFDLADSIYRQLRPALNSSTASHARILP